MSALLSSFQLVATFLGVWVVVSLVAVVPLILWFRAQAVANDAGDRAGRRAAWLAAAGRSAAR